MKKISILSFISIFILMMFGCQNQRTLPTAPAGTTTPPNVESTVAAVLTSAAIVNATGTAAAQKTATVAAGLYTSTVTSTITMTSTITQSPNATLTVEAILTIVANANATSTEAARKTQTYVASSWTPTYTPTYTCTPTLTPMPVGGEKWTYSTTATQFSPRYSHTSLVYNTVMWVIGGNDGVGLKNDVWWSSDGITWNLSPTTVAFSARYSHSSVVYDDGSGSKMWVIGGYDALSLKNDVWNSSDGIIWTKLTSAAGFSARDGFAALVYNNKMWVIGGYDGYYKNDVWWSSDGVTWYQSTAAAQFSAREKFTALVYNNQMWVIGGYDGSYKNDVWRSGNGVTWTQVATSGFNGRSLHTSVVYDDGSGPKMWVIGGLDIVGNLKNDVWSSINGVVWTQATAAAQFSPREGHTSVVYNNQMWVIAGYINPGYVSDVWHSQ